MNSHYCKCYAISNVFIAVFKNRSNDQYDADGDSKDICNLENLPDRQEEFKEFFGQGKVVGDTEINGNEASASIDLSGKKETAILTKKVGK